MDDIADGWFDREGSAAGSCSTNAHRVAVVAQPAEHGDEVSNIPRMKPHGRLVQDLDEIDEVAVELPVHLHPLALADSVGTPRLSDR